MKKALLLFLFPLLACSPKAIQKNLISIPDFDASKRLDRIAFGSCNKQNSSQEMWPYIIANDPGLWIWLGDNIYGDTEDMKVLKAKYAIQKSHSEYQALLQHCPVIGIWDDHDYGKNDAGNDYPKKEESRELMLDFLDVPKDAKVRNRKHGAYQSYTYGPKGKQVKIILLDARYFRDPLEPDHDSDQKFKPNLQGDILGEAQWQWLEQELTASTAQVHLIGSGIQFIPEEHFYEKWANFPKARKRFFDLLVKTKPTNPLLLSGDRHMAEFSKYQPTGLDYPIYEITASGLTHTWGIPKTEPNKHRVGEMIFKKNFAILNLDWSSKRPQMTVEVKGLNNESYLKEVLVY